MPKADAINKVTYEKQRKTVKKGEIGSDTALGFSGYFSSNDYQTLLRGPRRIKEYDEMRLGDATVGAAMLAVKQPILSARWWVDPASNSRKDRQIAEWVEEQLMECGTRTWQETLTEVLLYLDYGVMPFEIVYEFNKEGMIGLKKISSRWPSTVIKWTITESKLDGITQQTANGSYEIPMEKMVIFANQKEGGNWEGKSMLRTAWKHWHYKQHFYDMSAVGVERQSVGVPYAKKPIGGATPQDEADVKEVLENMRANEKAYVIYPDGWEVGFLDMKAGTTKNPEQLINHHDRAITLAVLAQFLTLGSTSVGSFALSQDQSKLFLLCLEAIANHVRDTFNRYLIKKLVDYNFDTEEYPKLAYEKIGAVDINMFTTALQRAIQTGSITPQPEDEEYLRDIMDLPEKNDAQDVDLTLFDSILEDLNGNMNEFNMANGEGIQPTDGVPQDQVEDPNNPGMDMNGDPMVDPNAQASWTNETWLKAADHIKFTVKAGAAGVPLSEETKRKISEALSKGKGKKGGKGKGKNPEVAKKTEEIRSIQKKVRDLNNEARGKLLEMRARGEKVDSQTAAKMQLDIFEKKNALVGQMDKLKGEISDIKAKSAPATPAPAKSEKKASDVGATLDRINGLLDGYEK